MPESLFKKALLKKRLRHRCFPVNFAKFLRTAFLLNTSGCLLLEPETQHNRLSSQEWRNCQNCKKIPNRLECACYHNIPEVKAFNLKVKTRLSWNIVDLKFTEAVVCLKVVGLQSYDFIKERLQRKCFPVNVTKFLRTSFFIEHLWWLLLNFL